MEDNILEYIIRYHAISTAQIFLTYPCLLMKSSEFSDWQLETTIPHFQTYWQVSL